MCEIPGSNLFSRGSPIGPKAEVGGRGLQPLKRSPSFIAKTRTFRRFEAHFLIRVVWRATVIQWPPCFTYTRVNQ